MSITMTDLDAGDFVTETDMDAIRGNIEFLLNLLRAGATISTLTAGYHITGVGHSAYGEYTGDGLGISGGGGQPIATTDQDSVSFQPDVVIIAQQTDGGVNAMYVRGFEGWTGSTGGVTITSSGFDASDGASNAFPNASGTLYTYIAMKF